MAIVKKVGYVLLFCIFFARFAWEILYFSIGEGFVLGLSGYLSVVFIVGWYRKAHRVTGFFEQVQLRLYFYLLPCIPVFLYFITLNTVASWDVIGEFFYILMYLLLGIAWLWASLNGMLLFWSFSYEDDVLMGRNKAAIVAATGAIIGSSLIYAGTNIGDGPGWWTVVIAGGLGTLTWLLLGALIDKLTAVIESITMEHDVNSGLRFGAYLVGSGLILAVASSGDWTSLLATVGEFFVGWPVIPLALLMIVLERRLFGAIGDEPEKQKQLSVIVAVCYLLYGILVCLLMLPTSGGR